METVIAYLVGLFLGGCAVYWGMRGAESRHTKARELAVPYESVKGAVLTYLRVHGTINRPALEHLISADRMTAVQCLYRIEREGFITYHGHDPISGFYTLS